MTVTLTSAGGLQPNQQYFTTSGNWTVPAGVTKATVTCVGGGAQNGTGGGYIKRTVSVTPGAIIPVTVGAGGVSSATVGGTSQFGSLLAAYGGIQASSTVQTANGTFTPPSGVAEEIGAARGGLALLKSLLLPSFTPANTGTFPSYSCPGAANNIYIINGSDGRTTYTSTDGVTWITNVNAIGSACMCISTVNNNFVAVAQASGTTAYYSTNGTSWTVASMPSSASWNLIPSNTTVALAYVYGSTNGAVSANGTTWTAVTLPASVTTMNYAGGYFWATNGSNTYYSATGATGSWTTCTGTISAFNASNIGYINGVWVTVTGTGNTAYYSSNATAWTSASIATSGTNTLYIQYVIGNTMYSVTYNSSSPTTGNLAYTTNGSVWTVITSSGAWFMPFINSTGNTNNIYIHQVPIYASYGGFQIAVGNNRYVVPMQTTTGTTTVTAWYSLHMFSDGFVGGNMGHSAVSGSGYSTVGFAGNGMGQGSYSYGNTTNLVTDAGFNGTTEGFCKGTNPSFNTVPNFGDGSSSPTGAGQGVVIVEWAA